LQSPSDQSQRPAPRACGLKFGNFPTGALNAITDVPGTRVGHVTLVERDVIRTGVTAIIPADGNLFQSKVPAGVEVFNGFGKLAGYTQLQELGNLETPILLTNTLSVPAALEALIDYTLNQPGNESVRSVNGVVGETNDGILNDIRARHVRMEHALESLQKASTGAFAQGCVGAGTGTICLGFKGGIGSSSRIVSLAAQQFTIGVIVQTNFPGRLLIGGVPVGEALNAGSSFAQKADEGSCVVIVGTDAPLDNRNLRRLARRAIWGIARTGGSGTNGSGDYAIAYSSAEPTRIQHQSPQLPPAGLISNDSMSPLFAAAIEATEEAIINSLFAAVTSRGFNGVTVPALPVDEVLALMKSYNR
jgi:D-aminopeptidase